MPPRFCTSATICRATVVLPEDSGPYTSMILPLGTPPTPRAISRLKEPVGTTSTFIFALSSPSFITAPLPNCFSIWLKAASNAFCLSSNLISSLLSFAFAAAMPQPPFQINRTYVLILLDFTGTVNRFFSPQRGFCQQYCPKNQDAAHIPPKGQSFSIKHRGNHCCKNRFRCDDKGCFAG